MKISSDDLVRLITREVQAQLAGNGGASTGAANGAAQKDVAFPATVSSATAGHQTAPTNTKYPTPQEIATEGFPSNISARHGHLTIEDVGVLFGEGQRLTPFKWLYQEGQFASEQVVTIVGPRGPISGVRILGPERKQSQFEVSLTDSIALGVMPPILQSVAHGTGSPITVVGPKGSVYLPTALIRAKRHVHLHPDEAALMGVKDGDEIPVEIPAGDQGLVLYNVLIRTDPSFRGEMHIDTDEGNAAGLKPGTRSLILSPRSGICQICR
jgi:putative phosphotransacetylase